MKRKSFAEQEKGMCERNRKKVANFIVLDSSASPQNDIPRRMQMQANNRVMLTIFLGLYRTPSAWVQKF